MSNENQGKYITVSLENNWTKMRTIKNVMMNCEQCKDLLFVLRYPSERQSVANTSVDVPLFT